MGCAQGDSQVHGGGAWRATCPDYAYCEIREISSKYEEIIQTSSSVSSGKGCKRSENSHRKKYSIYPREDSVKKGYLYSESWMVEEEHKLL